MCHVSEGNLITPALRKYPMENPMAIPKGYITENWSVHSDFYTAPFYSALSNESKNTSLPVESNF